MYPQKKRSSRGTMFKRKVFSRAQIGKILKISQDPQEARFSRGKFLKRHKRKDPQDPQDPQDSQDSQYACMLQTFLPAW